MLMLNYIMGLLGDVIGSDSNTTYVNVKHQVTAIKSSF